MQSEKKCGVTKITREVLCTRQMENSTEGVEIDNNLDCLEDLKPAAEKEVFLEPCTDVEWAVSEWSPCNECGSTVQTRRVECVNEEGESLVSSHNPRKGIMDLAQILRVQMFINVLSFVCQVAFMRTLSALPKRNLRLSRLVQILRCARIDGSLRSGVHARQPADQGFRPDLCSVPVWIRTPRPPPL